MRINKYNTKTKQKFLSSNGKYEAVAFDYECQCGCGRTYNFYDEYQSTKELLNELQWNLFGYCEEDDSIFKRYDKKIEELDTRIKEAYDYAGAAYGYADEKTGQLEYILSRIEQLEERVAELDNKEVYSNLLGHDFGLDRGRYY